MSISLSLLTALLVAQSPGELPDRDRIRLAETARVAGLGARPSLARLGAAAMPVLLVTDSAEFLLGHPSPSAEFSSYDSMVWTRPRRFSPTMLATFPAVGGMPTIVVGPPERTGKSAVDWVLTLMHEHFHQWQYSRPGYYDGVAALGLAHGDTTGRWMLDYPFPYDSSGVQQAVHWFAAELAKALVSSNLHEVVGARDRLRRLLSADDYRYLEFQLWQEGTARYIEFAVARAARGAVPSPAFRRLANHRRYGDAADEWLHALGEEFRGMDLERQRRAAFYPLGAAVALLLESSLPDWKQAYERHPFALAALLPSAP